MKSSTNNDIQVEESEKYTEEYNEEVSDKQSTVKEESIKGFEPTSGSINKEKEATLNKEKSPAHKVNIVTKNQNLEP